MDRLRRAWFTLLPVYESVDCGPAPVPVPKRGTGAARLLPYAEPMKSLRILIVDDHEVVRRGLRSLLSSRQDWEICGEAADGRAADLDQLQPAFGKLPNFIWFAEVLQFRFAHMAPFNSERTARIPSETGQRNVRTSYNIHI